MSRSITKLMLALPLLLGVAGCEGNGDDPLTGATDATFIVQAVNGVNVPSIATYADDPPLYIGCQLVQSGGVLALHANGRYTLQVSTGAIVCNGNMASGGGIAGTGDYVRDGESITLKPDFGLPHIVGTYSPTAGGTVGGTGYDGVVPIPEIVFSKASYTYRLTQEPNELR